MNYVPDEYVDFIICEKFGWTPDELNLVDDYLVQYFLEIIIEKSKAEYNAIKKS